MRLWTQSAMFAALALALTESVAAGPIIDRVVANINGHVILQSDWEEEVAFEALANGRAPDAFTSHERTAALDRLIDQELLREQVRPSQPAPPEQVAARVAEIRKLHPDCSTEEAWHSLLQRIGLSQAEVEKRLGDDIQLMKLVEDRLRPSIEIDQKAVEAYYQDQLVPNLKQTGDKVKPLTEIYGKIRTLLAEQKMNQLLTGWLANLRSGSHIMAPDSNTGEGNR